MKIIALEEGNMQTEEERKTEEVLERMGEEEAEGMILPQWMRCKRTAPVKSVTRFECNLCFWHAESSHCDVALRNAVQAHIDLHR